jgi:hypothetical protein
MHDDLPGRVFPHPDAGILNEYVSPSLPREVFPHPVAGIPSEYVSPSLPVLETFCSTIDPVQ